MTNKIIEILNKDTNIQEFMRTAADAANNTGVTAEEWNNAKEALMMIAISMCPKAMEVMAQETYVRLREAV
jgi:pantoate kinase